MRLKRLISEFKASDDSGKIDTCIGASVIIDGPLSSKKSVRIDGKLNGDLNTKGSLFTGPDSTINGSVTAKDAVICGTVNGNVNIAGRLIITSGAKLTGNLSVESLVIDEGALLNGNVTMLVKQLTEQQNEKNKQGKSTNENN